MANNKEDIIQRAEAIRHATLIQKKISMTTLARRLGIHKSTLSTYLNTDRLLKIVEDCEALLRRRK